MSAESAPVLAPAEAVGSEAGVVVAAEAATEVEAAVAVSEAAVDEQAEAIAQQERVQAAERIRTSALLPPAIRDCLARVVEASGETDRFTQMLVHGLVREGELLNLDARARQQIGQRFTFDRETSPQAGVLMHPRGIFRKSANYTVVADDNGLLFLADAAVTFTLPTKANGLAFRFAQTADANLVIAGSSDIVHKGSAAASSVTFSTSSEKIGSHVLVECVYTAASTLKWLVTNLGGTTATVA